MSLSGKTDDVKDQALLFGDFRAPNSCVEKRTLTSGSVYQFSSSLQTGAGYYLCSIGSNSYFTLHGTNPTVVDGTGSIGIPLLDSQYYPVMVPSSLGSGSLKLISGGTPQVFLWRIGEGSK